jgi:hypothetical protein
MENRMESKQRRTDSGSSLKLDVIKMEGKRLEEKYNRIKGSDDTEKCNHLSDILKRTYNKFNLQYKNFEQDTKVILGIEDEFGSICDDVYTSRSKLLKSIMQDNGYVNEDGKFKEDAMRDLVGKMGLVDNEGKIKKKEMLAINSRFYNKLESIREIFWGKIEVIQELRPNPEFDTIENNEYGLMETTLLHEVDAVLMKLPDTQVDKDIWHKYITENVEHRNLSHKMNDYKNKYTSYILNVQSYNLFLDSFNRNYGEEKSQSLDVSKIKTFINIDEEYCTQYFESKEALVLAELVRKKLSLNESASD